jgi:hypothetical protein
MKENVSNNEYRKDQSRNKNYRNNHSRRKNLAILKGLFFPVVRHDETPFSAPTYFLSSS